MDVVCLTGFRKPKGLGWKVHPQILTNIALFFYRYTYMKSIYLCIMTLLLTYVYAS